MKEKLLIFFLVILVLAVLVGLNAASYQQKEKTPDSELYANRSSFNSGATGTQAWYTLLAETGRKVTRWQEAPDSLLTSKTPPSVFVVIGFPRREITAKEAETILTWVARGGRLVLVDREPQKELAVTTSDWNIGVRMVPTREVFTVDPSNQQQMTQGVEALHASQPTVLTQGVNAIQPSKFVQNITLEPRSATAGEGGDATDVEKPPPPKEYRGDRVFGSPVPAETPSGPLVHFGTHEKNVVVEVPYESGTIVFVADPYMVSNAGIQLADNAHLATNLVATSSGTVAFDEYHQGYSNDSNRFLQFFAGTPVVAIFLQAVVLIGFIFYSQSRRFARPVPEPEPDRLSKLEYVTAMAELQQRTRAWDLAVENIYTDFRRRAARLFGIDVSQATSDELAKRIAERTGLAAPDLRDTLFKCEEIIRGEPTNKSEVIRLVDTIRSIESTLGLRRSRFGK